MIKKTLWITVLVLGMTFEATAAEQLSVYPAVPGLDPSVHYSFRVRQVGSEQWMTPFAWFTDCVPSTPANDATKYYSEYIGSWSNTYCNFEMADNVPVEVEITRLDPSTGTPVAIQKAVPHPRRKVKSWRIENGKAYVIIDKPVLFAVDIDGQLDEQDAPRIVDGIWGDDAVYSGPPIHTVTVFANPFILDKPSLNDPKVYAVNPGEIPPQTGSWSILYFKPGVHRLFVGDRLDVYYDGCDFQLKSDKSYYIPGDAIVYGHMNTFDNDEANIWTRNARVFGHGTLSGAKSSHPEDMQPPVGHLDVGVRLRTLEFVRATGCRVEGITFADSANHTCKVDSLGYADPAEKPINYARWLKVFTWRANGDGITVKGNSYLEDCFIRAQDDGTYVRGLGIHRNVYWNDVNGKALRCSFITSDRTAGYPASLPQQLIVEDIDVIYGRGMFLSGRSVISRPGGNAGADLGGGVKNTGQHVVFRNINVEDPRPVRRCIGMMEAEDTPGAGDIAGILFKNIRVASNPVFGDLNVLWGFSNAQVYNLTLDNFVQVGEHFDSLNDFKYDEYAHSMIFSNTAPETMTYLNTSGYGKWYVYGDWNGGVEPANNDIVNHTAVAEVLTVDAPAYAGTLNIAHADTAAVSIALGGKLNITHAVSLGAAGSGRLNLLDGNLKLQSSLGSALSVANGNIHIENGTLLWAGNHISDIQALYAAGKLTLAKGQDAMLSASATLIGQYGQSKLYADYNNATAGYTTVWVARLTEIVVNLHVEAENYTAMNGIQTQSTTDTGGGLNTGYIHTGDWADYAINIPAAGTYTVDFRVASGSSGGMINMVVGGSAIGTAATVTGTGGWQTWTTVSTTATFNTTGTQTLRLNFVGGGGFLYNINWFKCTISIPLLPSDLNGDNKVNLVDFALMSEGWQNGCEMTDLLKMAEDWLIN
jgi:hypothetical protein